MTSPRLQRNETSLVVIDIQTRLAAAMPETEASTAIANAVRLVRGAGVLDLPVLVTEQYPTGLGPTVPALAEALGTLRHAPETIEKTEFDACANAACATAFERLPKTVVLAGMESHICVWQTARSLLARGHSVHVAIDATCSRAPENRRIAEGLLGRAGAVVTSTETVLFDLLGGAKAAGFKEISRLVR